MEVCVLLMRNDDRELQDLTVIPGSLLDNPEVKQAIEETWGTDWRVSAWSPTFVATPDEVREWIANPRSH